MIAQGGHCDSSRPACQSRVRCVHDGIFDALHMSLMSCSSNAGVSLAMLAHAYNCHCHIAMPDDAAQEKGAMLEALGMCCTLHDTCHQ